MEKVYIQTQKNIQPYKIKAKPTKTPQLIDENNIPIVVDSQ